MNPEISIADCRLLSPVRVESWAWNFRIPNRVDKVYSRGGNSYHGDSEGSAINPQEDRERAKIAQVATNLGVPHQGHEVQQLR